jgi:hypothetical protein
MAGQSRIRAACFQFPARLRHALHRDQHPFAGLRQDLPSRVCSKSVTPSRFLAAQAPTDRGGVHAQGLTGHGEFARGAPRPKRFENRSSP